MEKWTPSLTLRSQMSKNHFIPTSVGKTNKSTLIASKPNHFLTRNKNQILLLF